jgi:bla regulator protein blaR1
MVLKANSFTVASGTSVGSAGEKSNSITIKAPGTQGTGTLTLSGDATFEGLVIINGKEAVNHDGKAISRIKPNDIESINVLEGEAAVKEYGRRGKDGVIQITLKKK